MYDVLGSVVLGDGGGGGIAYPAPSGETIGDMDMLEAKAWDHLAGCGVDPAVLGGVHKSTFHVTREEHDGYCSDQDFERRPHTRRQTATVMIVWSLQAPDLPVGETWVWDTGNHVVCGLAPIRAVLQAHETLPWEDVRHTLTSSY